MSATTGLPGRPDAAGWRRLHKLTPLVRGWKLFIGVLVVLGHNGLNGSADFDGLFSSWSSTVLLIAGGIVLIALIATLSWWNTAYRLESGVIQYRKGVVVRQTRQAPLDRLQAVDVVQPFVGRLVGLSELRLEVAGGAGSDFRLAYLRDEDAQRVRRVLLAQAAGLAGHNGGADEQEAPEAPQHQLYELNTSVLVISSLLSQTMLALVALLVVAAVGVALDPAVALAFLPGLVTAGAVVWAAVSSRFGFTVATSPDGIRLRHGLLERRSQTVPPGRVQALEIIQPLLWRRRGWWMVKMNVAGYGKANNEQKAGTETLLLPVGTAEQVALVVSLVVPELGVDDPREALELAMHGLSSAGHDQGGFVCAPRQAVWLDPVGWRRRGVLVGSRCLLIRSGRLRRYVQLVPYERVQAIGAVQGPVQRRLGMASVLVHSTRGPVRPRVDHLRERDAAALVTAACEHARVARAAALHQRWMLRAQREPAAVSAPVGHEVGAAPDTPNLLAPPPSSAR